MDLLKEIQRSKVIIKSTIDMLGAHQSTLEQAEAVLIADKQPSTRAKARQVNKALIMQDIMTLELKQGKPTIAKRKSK